MKLHTKLCALCLLGLSVLQAQAQDSDMLTQSRAVTQAMLKELGQKLQSSMAEGGPINAIGVCHLQAPDIANRASTNSQAKISRVGTIAGCFVTQGVVERSAKVRVIRRGVVIYPPAERSAGLESLKRFKDDCKDVREGMECGLKVAGYDDIKVDDVIEAYRIDQVKRTL